MINSLRWLDAGIDLVEILRITPFILDGVLEGMKHLFIWLLRLINGNWYFLQNLCILRDLVLFAMNQLCGCPTSHINRAVSTRSLRRRPYRMKSNAVGFISLATVNFYALSVLSNVYRSCLQTAFKVLCYQVQPKASYNDELKETCV